ncbi:hypothetical protein FBZ89_14022 [Nitrospirillum amazonense]|uniref:Sulfotransferase family protein n=2 Tax=Nitrospirillum amazonense TaxID=28077 RepID=A0A560EK11_9PROT|nr:hypothetical protein FBZ89_14022 [Nitrospirillum amazonense]
MSFVRNPWDRMVSLYTYHRSVEYGLFSKFNASHALARDYDFQEWLRISLSGTKRPNWFGIPQAEWVRDVTDVSMFEKYDMEMERICTKFSIPYARTARNASERRHYSEYYDRKDLIAAVGQIDAEIVNRFGYTFD